jgi:predicted Zn-dependent protease with MMP-like domain
MRADRENTTGWGKAVSERLAQRQRFDELVEQALESLPAEASAALQNVAIVVADSGPRDLLGLYEGIPLPARDNSYTGVLPDVITLFRNAIAAKCRTDADLVREVRTTVLHELGHYFGIDDERLHQLGWA